MSSDFENTYWISIAHLPKWNIERINKLIIRVIHENKMNWQDFFSLGRSGWREVYDFSDKELADLESAKIDLPQVAFIAEQLLNEGFHVIPINSNEYPLVLKENLKIKSSPPVLYIKGRKGLLKEEAFAIVGSRSAGKVALEFTDRVAKKAVTGFRVVVSGFAKGVDKQALDSTIEANGKSIIVLPQGILTFQSGFRKYYESIASGDVLVLSTFFPKAGWDVGLAMARNAYIYGLAKEIYVAESDSKGGTWEGALDGLKRNRKVYVRQPAAGEKNANLKLIEMGGIPVDMDGDPIVIEKDQTNQPVSSFEDEPRNIEKEILDLLKKGSYSAKEIMLIVKLDWDSRKLSNYLKKNPNISTIEGKPKKFGIAQTINLKLFD
jgi:DNA processing protein